MSVFHHLYARLPVPLQDVCVTLKGLDFRLRRESLRIRRQTYRFLLRSETWSAQELRAYQERRLRDHLERVVAEVPYYRDRSAYRRVLDFPGTALDALRRLPILTKQAVREHQESFVNPEIPRYRCTEIFTSGTTGTPLRLLETRRSFSERFAFVSRLRHWAGLQEPHLPRRAQFTGRDVVPDSTTREDGVYWRRNLAGNALLFSTTHVDEKTAAGYLQALRRFRPVLVDGYPSALTALARLGRAQGLEFPRPRAILTTAETLASADRAVLETAFACRVYDQYAASEPSCFWSECEHGTLHVHPEQGISEILDHEGRPVEPGEEGDVIVTSFLNPATPLLRYRLGDRAVPSGQACPCGRALPTVERVVGREDDVLYVPGRGWVGRLDPVFKGVDGLVEARIVQDAPRRVRLEAVPAPGCDWPRTRATLLENLRRKLGPAPELEVRRVRRLPRGANGKLRSVVSYVSRDPAAADSSVAAKPVETGR